ncbi:MAG TPA: hypothetical protein VFZ09_45425 [Archangium sp.]|uniref:hypothetical protein n=1 Tax=Archangium sp. TaxID=1872627 RepID=UPI002E30DBDB|nr:hypothetical protein [Archangium sp.]HEX5753524.1 hypothetical protein [Archangium sp.]
MSFEEDKRTRQGGRTRRTVLVGLLLTVLLVGLYLYRHEIVLALIFGRGVDVEWARDVQRDNSTGHESAHGVIATGNGFSVVGQTNSRQHGVEHAWVLRFDKAPPPRWERTHAGNGKLGAASRAIASMQGGGLVVAGTEYVTGGGFQEWLLALSPAGDVLWERTPGREGVNGLDAVVVLEDGSIVAGGRQDREGWVVRMDSRGDMLWEVKLPRLERVNALVALPAQRVAVLGVTETSTVGLGVSRLLLLESDGRATVETRLPTDGRGELEALALLPDGGLVATGSLSRPDSMDWSFWVICMNARGEPRWEYVSELLRMDAGSALTVLPDGGVAVVGFWWKDLFKDDREAKVWRFSADGRLLWQRSYGGDKDDSGSGIARLEDGSLVVVGTTMSKGAGKTDLWTFGLSPEGELLWEETFGAP